MRDFTQAHPDFYNNHGDQEDSGIVRTVLGSNSRPEYASSGSTSTTSGQSNFDEWWQPTPGVNAEKVVSLTFSDSVTSDLNVFTFVSDAFYLADDALLGNEGNPHNGLFTLQIPSFITYNGGEVFQYSSADDLWIFIDGHLAVDLGGIHQSQPDTATLQVDAFASAFGLQQGETYRFDFFY